MKNNIPLSVMAATILALTLGLAASSPAYAITSVAVSKEQSKNGPGDTFKDDGKEPAYADRVVDGILGPLPSEMTMVYVTQESEAKDVVPVIAASSAQQQPSPVGDVAVAQASVATVASQPESAPAETPAPAEEDATPVSQQDITQELTQESPVAAPQILGVATESDSLDPIISANLRKVLKNVETNQGLMKNLFQIGILLFLVMLPVMGISLYLQVKMLAAIGISAKAKAGKRSKTKASKP